MFKQIRGGFRAYFRTDIYHRFLPYIRPHRLPMAVVIAFTFLQSGLALLDPWPMKILIDSGLSQKRLPDRFGQVFPFLRSGNPRAIIFFAVALILVLWLVGNIVGMISDYIKSRVNASITLRFKADLFNHLQRLSFSYHDQTTVGDSMYRLNNDTDFISTLIWGNFRHLITSTVTLVGILWIVIRLDWVIAVLALAASPLLYLSIGFYGKFFKDKSKQVKGIESLSQTIIQEVLSCLRVVKAFGMEEREQQRYEEQAWRSLRARMRLSVQQSLFSIGTSAITKLDRSLILLVGAFHVSSGRLTVGELLVLLAYVSQIHGPLEDIGQTLTDMQLSLASAERTLDVLDVVPAIQDSPHARTLARVAGRIAFEGVGFGYHPDNPVLKQVSFEAPPGEVIAIVGPTGAGKTTTANLIARFYDPIAGRVLLDGHDLRDLTVQTLRDNIALVIQEPILFTGTVRENIAYGRPGASLDEIIQAAKDANAHDFVMALPAGYESQVGARGVRLSGGERQRIAIARAFLKDAPILILDEPTSSIDARTELSILDALDTLMIGRTTFIIAHRLATIRHADQILVIDKGQVAERGTHAELVEHGGIYAHFYEIQTGGIRRRAEVSA